MAELAFRFDAKHPDALANANAHAAAYVTRVSESTRAAMRGIVARSIEDGVTPRDVAKQVKGVLLSARSGSEMARTVAGLNRRQALAVDNLRRNLEASATRGKRRMTPKKQAAIDAKVRRYARKQLRRRADNIARTEIMGALNAGALEAGRQAQVAGVLINPIKKWFVAIDDRLCPICRPLSGEVRALDEPFSNQQQFPPAHPSCRCTASVREHPLTKKGKAPPPRVGRTPEPRTAAEFGLRAFRQLPQEGGAIASRAIFDRVDRTGRFDKPPEGDLKQTTVSPMGVRGMVATVPALSAVRIQGLITRDLGWLARPPLPRLVFWRGRWYVLKGHHELAAASLLGMNIRAFYTPL